MTLFYAFNGDADGLCALQQLRLVDPRDAILVTGVKRDIQLLRRVNAADGDDVTVLDISLDANRDDLHRLLEAGTAVRYFDHHYAGELPQHRSLEAHIEESSDVCTSTLVDRHLAGRHRPWAIVAAFGDNLKGLASAMAKAAGVDALTAATLERLGICLNYNAYGNTVSDLCFDPEDLAQQMLPFADPMEFVRRSPAFVRLGARYEEDMLRARTLEPARHVPGATMVILPDEAWARRAIGVLANELTQSQPDCAFAILSPRPQGGFTVSVRVPAHRPVAADEFCRSFGTGGAGDSLLESTICPHRTWIGLQQASKRVSAPVESQPTMDLLNPLAGFLVGVLVGFTGVGGGALMTPLLVLMFGVAPQTAIGTDLLFAAITKSFGGWVHGARGSIDWLVLRRLAAGSLPAALLTLALLHFYPEERQTGALLLPALGVALTLTSIALLFQRSLHRLGRRLRTTEPDRFKRAQPGLTVAAGALLGFLVTLTSVGAGALGVVMLVYLYPYRLTPAKLVGTDIAHAIPLTLVAGLGHWSLGNVNFLLLAGLLAGSIPGIIIGSRLSVNVSSVYVRNAIAAMLAFVGSKLLLQG